jgi:hypothetical protein
MDYSDQHIRSNEGNYVDGGNEAQHPPPGHYHEHQEYDIPSGAVDHNGVNDHQRTSYEARSTGIPRFRSNVGQSFHSDQNLGDRSGLGEMNTFYDQEVQEHDYDGMDQTAGIQQYQYPEPNPTAVANESYFNGAFEEVIDEAAIYQENDQAGGTTDMLFASLPRHNRLEATADIQHRHDIAAPSHSRRHDQLAPSHLRDIYIPPAALHRRPSDVTTEGINSLRQPSTFSTAEYAAARTYQDTGPNWSGEVADSDTRSHGISRFRSRADLSDSIPLASEVDTMHPHGVEQQWGTPLAQETGGFLESEIHEKYHTKKTRLRFFNDGVEVDCSGRPLSRPGSPRNPGPFSSNGCNRVNSVQKRTEDDGPSDTEFLRTADDAEGQPLWDSALP